MTEARIRSLVVDLAVGVVSRLDPEPVARTGREDFRRRLSPSSLAPVTAGDEPAVRLAQLVVQAIESSPPLLDVLRGAPAQAALFDVLTQTVRDAVVSVARAELPRLTYNPESIGDAVVHSLTDHPSWVDRLACSAGPPAESDWLFHDKVRALQRTLVRCLVRVENRTRGWIGTGFAVSRFRLLTAAHVVGTSDDIVAVFGVNGRTAEAKVEALAVDAQNDLAVLRPRDGAGQVEMAEAHLSTETVSLRVSDVPAGTHVLCLGYHAGAALPGARFVSPCPAVARVALFSPIREVEFEEDGITQSCLVMVVPEGEETIRQGMSGGPILDLDASGRERGEIVAMITGAKRPGRIRQPYGKDERLPVAEYGLGVLFGNVAAACPEFAELCSSRRF